MDPVSLTLGLGNLAGGLYGISSARRQRKRLKAELEKRRLSLIESKNMAIGRVAEGTAAAKSPLEALAERVRTEESFRDPVLEQSAQAGFREQAGAQLRQTEAARGSSSQGLPREQLMMAALMGQVGMASESRRLARRMESTRALSGIYGQLSEITQSGAQSAAGIETQFASALQNEPILNNSPYDPLGQSIGGLLSFLGTDSGKEALGGLFSKFQGQPEATAPAASVAGGNGTWITDKIRPWWEGMMSLGTDYDARYSR